MLYRYLILILWKSGRVYGYCAQASSADEALSLLTNGRSNDVKASRAYEWPRELGGPRLTTTRATGFRLKSEETLNAAKAALGATDPTEPRIIPGRPPGPGKRHHAS